MKVRECASAGAIGKLFLMLVTEKQRKSGIPVLQAQQERGTWTWACCPYQWWHIQTKLAIL